MPRHARQMTDYLHLIVRGAGKQVLFENDWDKRHYLSLLKKYSEEQEIQINAYCLMENHVHLLVYDPEANVALFMKKIGICYAQYYNKKYEHTGHLFQDRYKSENITNDAYYLTVFRYILKNPEKAGICAAEDYKWSSFNEFGRKDALTDTSLLNSLLKDKTLHEYMSIEEETECMEYDTEIVGDGAALRYIHNELMLQSGTIIKSMEKEKRNAIIALMKERGLSCRQIERLTGVGRNIVRKI